MAASGDALAKWRRSLAAAIDCDSWGQIDEAEQAYAGLAEAMKREVAAMQANGTVSDADAGFLKEVALACALRANALGGDGDETVDRELLEAARKCLDELANGTQKQLPPNLNRGLRNTRLAASFGLGRGGGGAGAGASRAPPLPAATSRGSAVISETGLDTFDDDDDGGKAHPSAAHRGGLSTSADGDDDDDDAKGKRGGFFGRFFGGRKQQDKMQDVGKCLPESLVNVGPQGNLPPPVALGRFGVAADLLTVTVNRIGLKDAGEYIDGRMRVVLRNKLGNVVRDNDFVTPISNNKEDQHILFDHDVHIQHPFNEINEKCALFFEFIHYKAMEKKLSCKAWSFMDMAEIRKAAKDGGSAVLEVYAKPVDPLHKRFNLLSVKQLYLHVTVNLQRSG